MSTQKEIAKSGGELVAASDFEVVAERLNGLSVRLEVKPFEKMFILAQAINELRNALTEEVMDPIMQLQGTRLGFKTDKDTIKNKDTNWKVVKGPGYPVEIVRQVTMEAILFGAYMTGNEVNIISGQMYATKEHFIRKVRELEGLTNLKAQIGTPIVEEGVAKARCKAEWKMHGIEQSVGMDAEFPLVFSTRVHDREGGHSVATDQALGKITRKFYKYIYEIATGSNLAIPDGDASEAARDVEAKVVDRASVNIDDIKAGDSAEHTPVDQPQPRAKKKATAAEDFIRALSDLSAAYEGREDEIDDMLKNAGTDMPLQDIREDCADENARRAVILTAKGL